MERVTQNSDEILKMLKYVAIIVAFIMLLKMYVGEREKKIEQKNLIEAANDKLQHWKPNNKGF